MRRSPAPLLCLLCACSAETTTETPATVIHPQFTVRGRWDDVSTLSYRIEPAGSPLDAEGFRQAIERAMEPWQQTGVVIFEVVRDGRPDVTFAWRRGSHDSCEPFGSSTAIAHSGPVGPGTFVHFDAGRTWSEGGSEGESIFHAALHELGHVLGLGHSDSPDALLHPAANDTRSTLSESELAGLHSLYGGGSDGDGDVLIVGAEILENRAGPTGLDLRRISPSDVTGATTFDSDGDGDDEILVWRTDEAGNGALMIYHFDEALKLSHTVGPLYGMSAPGVPNLFVRTVEGERLMVCIYDGDRLLTRRFDERGFLVPRPDAPLIVEDGIRDADGDGLLDAPYEPRAYDARLRGHVLENTESADLNGDGRYEVVFPLRSGPGR